MTSVLPESRVANGRPASPPYVSPQAVSTSVPRTLRDAALPVGPYVPKLWPSAPTVNAADLHKVGVPAAGSAEGASADPMAASFAPIGSPALDPFVTPAFGSPATADAMWTPNTMPVVAPSELSEVDETTLPWIDTFLSSTPVRPMTAVAERSTLSPRAAVDPQEEGGEVHAGDRSAEEAAAVLESVARRLRDGELSLSGFDAKLGDAAALAAVLSSILGVRH